jgi:hypothetical protein
MRRSAVNWRFVAKHQGRARSVSDAGAPCPECRPGSPHSSKRLPRAEGRWSRARIEGRPEAVARVRDRARCFRTERALSPRREGVRRASEHGPPIWCASTAVEPPVLRHTRPQRMPFLTPRAERTAGAQGTPRDASGVQNEGGLSTAPLAHGRGVPLMGVARRLPFDRLYVKKTPQTVGVIFRGSTAR